jgi:rubrerythrin
MNAKSAVTEAVPSVQPGIKSDWRCIKCHSALVEGEATLIVGMCGKNIMSRVVCKCPICNRTKIRFKKLEE